MMSSFRIRSRGAIRGFFFIHNKTAHETRRRLKNIWIFRIFYQQVLDFHVFAWYNIYILRKEVNIMGKSKRKKSKAAKIDYLQILIQAAVDFSIGFLLMILDKIIK